MSAVRTREQRIAWADAANRFRLARAVGQVGYWQWDLEKDQLLIDSQLRKLLGFDRGGRRSIDWRAHIHRDDLATVLKAAREHVAEQSPMFEVQHRIVDKDDNVRWFLSRGQALLTQIDQVHCIVGTAIDITDRKREEDEQSRIHAQLQKQRVELAHLARAAAAGALTGALAHELRQPLSAILTNAQAGLFYLAKPDIARDDLAEILAEIEREGRRAGAIISNLRNMLRPGEEQIGTVYLHHVVPAVLSLLRSDLVARNVQVVVGPLADLPPIVADLVQLQQVFLNLINNACDALTDVDPRDRRVVIESSVNDGKLNITVSDNGCGLRELDADSIFKPFVSTKRQGLGLGLSISRLIVEAHGGRIWAENSSLGGTSMRMEFSAVPHTSNTDESTPPGGTLAPVSQ